jgi:serine protease inhibitor
MPGPALRSLLLLTLLAPTACRLVTDPHGDQRRIESLPRPLTRAEQEVIASSNDFAFALLREVHAREQAPNVFISPLSASMALGMTLNGAAGGTFDAMRATLGFAGLSQEEINRAYHDLVALLLDLDPRVELHIANSTWARDGFPFHAEFFDALRTWFDADARQLDFADPGAVDAINRWAGDNTRGRIRRVLESIDPDHILFLLNAVYFKGDWTTRFDRAATAPAPFTLADGRQVEVQSMSGMIRGGMRWIDGVVIGELPYGGQAFVMNVVLPPHGASLADLIAGLDAGTWAGWTQSLPQDYGTVEPMEVRLPRVELEYETLLNEPLGALGMGVAFTPGQADFSRLTPEDAYLDFVKQNTFLRVDEEGTEAASVTTVGVRTVSVPAALIVDRPYLLVIRERLSGAVLFMGAIGDPR